MKSIEKFRKNLGMDKRLIGVSVTYTDPLVTDTMGESADFFWIDLEHCAMSMEALAGHLLAARSRNVPALVRVSGSSTPFIKMVLDAGADGIIVPQVKYLDEVKSVVDDCRYPPLGKRGYGPRVPSNYGRNGGDEYLKWANSNIFVAVQIETKEALGSIDEIVKVPGLDSVVIGPMDLSGSLCGLGQVDNPIVIQAIDIIIEKAHNAGLSVGAGMGPDPDYAIFLAQKGVQWLQMGGDYGYLANIVDQTIGLTKKRLGKQAVV